MNVDDLTNANIARTTRLFRGRFGDSLAVKNCQDQREQYAPGSLRAAFWSRVIAQLLFLERPSPEDAAMRPGEMDDARAWFEDHGLIVEPLPPAPVASTTRSTAPDVEQGRLF